MWPFIGLLRLIRLTFQIWKTPIGQSLHSTIPAFRSESCNDDHSANDAHLCSIKIACSSLFYQFATIAGYSGQKSMLSVEMVGLDREAVIDNVQVSIQGDWFSPMCPGILTQSQLFHFILKPDTPSRSHQIDIDCLILAIKVKMHILK